MNNSIQVKVSKKELTLTPDLPNDSSDRNKLTVEIKNVSREFASFHLELTTGGIDPSSNVEWYKVEPEVSAKKPPGDVTEFEIHIIKAPIPAYDTTIDLTLKAFSIEVPSLFATENLRLTIEKPCIPLRIYVPIKKLKTYPGDSVNIIIFAYNLSSQSTLITLKLSKLKSEWFEGSTTQTFSIDPGENAEKIFRCTPPRSPFTSSQIYEFLVEAKTENQYPTQERGTLEVLPQGEIEFYCDRTQQSIPQDKRATKRKRRANTAIYTLEFTNSSNLDRQIDLDISANERKKCGLSLPEPLTLLSGKQGETDLIARKKRPWLGAGKKLTFEVKPLLSEPKAEHSSQLIPVRPNSKIFELQVKPRIPFLWQLGVGLLALLLLLFGVWQWGLPFQSYHTASVNSVRFNRDASTVLSGSSDKSLRRWQVDKTQLFTLSRDRLIGQGKKGETNDKAIQVVREQPGQARKQDLFAVGLENGEIQLWDMLSSSDFPEKQLRLTDKTGRPRSDRLFDLAFSDDFQHLFSVHGSGFLYQWDLFQPNPQPQAIVNLERTMTSLAFSNISLPDNRKAVFLAGRYNQLFFLLMKVNDERSKTLKNLRLYQVFDKLSPAERQFEFKPIQSQENYIEALAIAQNNSQEEILAVADNSGTITLWNSDRLLQCLKKQDKNFGSRQSNIYNDGGIISPLSVQCSSAVLERWNDGHQGTAVRSVALTSNACYLASAGDDGRVMLWPLNLQGQRTDKKGIVLDRLSDSKFNTVDLKADNHYVFATSGAEDGRVRLNRRELMKDNAECYSKSTIFR